MIMTGSAKETRTEPCSEGINLESNDANRIFMELEDSGSIESMYDDTIDIQRNDAYGVELEGSGDKQYENVLDFI